MTLGRRAFFSLVFLCVILLTAPLGVAGEQRQDELTGSIEPEKDRYPRGHYVDFDIYVNESGEDYYYGYVRMLILFNTMEVANQSVYVSYGHTSDSYYINDSAFIGSYDVLLMDYDQTYIITTASFDVFMPQYSADVSIYDGYGEEKITFQKEDYVYVEVHIEDQFANPAEGSGYALVTLGTEEISNKSLNFNYWSEGNDSFTLSYYETEESGKYDIQIYFGGQLVGSGSFRVLGFAKVELDRHLYAPGAVMSIDVSVDMYQVSIDIHDSDGETIDVPDSWEDHVLPADGNETLSFALPTSLGDGTYSVCVYDTKGQIIVQELFQVKYFTFTLRPEKSVYLAGQDIKLFYTVISNLDGEPVHGLHIEIKMTYRTSKGEKTTEAMKHAEEGIGSFEMVMPADAEPGDYGYYGYGGCTISGWANDTGNQHSGSDTTYVSVGVAELDLYLDAGSYSLGDFAVCTVETTVSGNYDTSPLSDVSLSREIYVKDSNGDYTKFRDKISVPYSTDASGRAIFDIDLDTDFDNGDYRVEVTGYVSDLGIEVQGQAYFTVSGRFGALDMDLWMTRDPYLSGEQAKCNFVVGYTSGRPVENDVQVDYNLVADSGVVVDVGHRVSENGLGSITLDLPSTLSGEMTLTVTAINDTVSSVTDSVRFTVSYSLIVLNTEPQKFSDGDTVKVKYELAKAAKGNIEYYFSAYGGGSTRYVDSNFVLKKEHKTSYGTSGSFGFTVSKGCPLDSVTVEVSALDSEGHYSQATTSVPRDTGLSLTVTMDREIYHPGETIVLKYNIDYRDRTPQDRAVSFIVYLSSAPDRDKRYQRYDTRGELRFTVPKDTKEGKYYLVAGLTSGSSYYGMSVVQAVNIREEGVMNPITEGLESNQGAVDLALLILIIVLFLGLMFSMRRRGKGEKRPDKKSREEKMVPPPPPEEATPPPPEEEMSDMEWS